MPIDDKFYRAFEEKFRGSEEEIRRRLEFYTPLLKVYAEAYPSSRPKALDIGCGRGEMLSLYKDYGFEAFGIDINKEFVEYSKSKGFDVAYADALDFLKSQEDNTYDIISLIHVLEHLSFEYAFELHKEVLRVLKPGGSYIVEFPFAENISMGTIDFWLDPTHLRPIHPEAVKFTWEYLGFINVDYFGVHAVYKPLEEIEIKDIVSYYVAPNVAVLGIKSISNSFFLEAIKSSMLYMKSNSSHRLQDILSQIGTNINASIEPKFKELSSLNESTKKEFNERLNHLNEFILAVKAGLDMITTSKLWRAYSFLGKVKRKAKWILRLDKKELPKVVETNIEKKDTQKEIITPAMLGPTTKNIYKKLKFLK